MRARWSIWSSWGQFVLVERNRATEEEVRAALQPRLAVARISGAFDDSPPDRFRLHELASVLDSSMAYDSARLPDSYFRRMIVEALKRGALLALPVSPPSTLGYLPPRPVKPDSQQPKEGEEPEVTVKITAEDKGAPPAAVAVSGSIKLRGLPSKEGGTYKWSTSSPRITLQGDTLQTVTVVANKDPSPSLLAEEVQLVFTPTGHSALAPVMHQLSVASLVFQKEASHPWGYDPYEKIPSRDKDVVDTEPTPGPQQDFISIKKQGIGKASVVLSGVAPSNVFFKSSDESVCKPKSKQPSQTPFVLEIEAQAKDKSEAAIEARLGSESGPLLAKLGVVVLKEVSYLAELFRVTDSTSSDTALTVSSSAAGVKSALNDYYKQGVATWDIAGSSTDVDAAYDIIKNGKLDLEPGKQTDEQKKIIAACTSTRTRVVHVHKLRWCYYFAADAKATDTQIKIKNYGTGYLGYIGKKSYTIEDSTGQTTSITVTAVNTSTGEITLAGPLGKDFKTADHSALIWPLGGLSGDPLWVCDKSSESVLNNYIAHELGHTSVGLADLCERNNLMHGGSDTGTMLRHRPLSKYYSTGQNEEQWKSMKKR